MWDEGEGGEGREGRGEKEEGLSHCGEICIITASKKLDSGRRSKNKLKSIDIKKKCAAKNKEQEICTKNSQC